MREKTPCEKCKEKLCLGRCCMGCNDRIGRLRDREAKGIITDEERAELAPFPRVKSTENPGCSEEMASKIVDLLNNGGRCGQRGGIDSFRLGSATATGMKFSAFGSETVMARKGQPVTGFDETAYRNKEPGAWKPVEGRRTL